MKRSRYIVSFAIVTVMLFASGAMAQAQNSSINTSSNNDHVSFLLVRCKGDGTAKTLITGTTEHECGFQDAVAEVKLLINFLFLLSVPVTVMAIAWSGIQILLAQGNTGKLNESKKRLTSILKGFLFVLGGWLLVYTIAKFLLKPEYYQPFLGGNSSANSSSQLTPSP